MFLLFFSEHVLTLASGSWSVTPRDILEVAERVDRHCLGEHWEKNNIGEHTDKVRDGIVEEVSWPQDHWEDEHYEHHISSEDGPVEVRSSNEFIGDIFPHAFLALFITLEFHNIWVKAGTLKEHKYGADHHDGADSEDNTKYFEIHHGLSNVCSERDKQYEQDNRKVEYGES